ncbi:hypothetical protein C5Y96_07085 [Blastopirellula marina]|uniref:Knr4/Smi1-like domain-containing protein n=1 Tax=Blastopirellula marina TaxID=124 RepID=A0A2S8FXM2_9BACT|nr:MULTISPECIES: SMI1/KNR4 family protein [Pirellulaceae]PQO36919.1 hypothetical protein C5Y96_07085 [Blastopirellula marina]RCS53634.1 hypothetical protein DTL36_07095 [Bremerella cremea]
MTTTPESIEQTIQACYPAVTAAFNPPATEAEIAAAERQLGVEFPAEFKQFYLAANGQQLDELGCGVGVPAVPRMPLGGGSSETCTWGEFLTLDGVVQATLAHRELAEFDFPDDDNVELVGPVTVHRNHLIFCDPGTGDSLGLDLAPPSIGQKYQVVAINHDPSGFACLASSFTEFVAQVVRAISSDDFVYTEEEGCFLPADEA